MPCIDSCEASGRAGLPPAPHHPIFARPDTRHHAFKGSRIKANPAFGRADISGCSGAVCGSRPMAATILECHAAVHGDWPPRSPRSGSTAHRSDRLSVAFYAPAIKRCFILSQGVVTGKRVAAHQVMRRRVRSAGGCWRSPGFLRERSSLDGALGQPERNSKSLRTTRVRETAKKPAAASAPTHLRMPLPCGRPLRCHPTRQTGDDLASDRSVKGR